MPLLSLLLLASQQSAPPAEIHVDGRCRVYSQDRGGPDQGFSKAKFRDDKSLCQLVSEHKTHHWEETLDNGVMKRTYVTVVEHEFVLHDIANVPVVFVVDQAVPDGWRIDSDPQPAEIENHVARFYVRVEPGQTVRLHVGERH